MNFFKKYKVFAISMAVASILLIIAAVKLVSYVSAFEGEKRALMRATRRGQQLHNRTPYPSLENVRKETENVANLQRIYSDLNETLRKGQIEEEMMEAADFMALLENTLRRMRSRLNHVRIVIPANFAFDFDQYAGGRLPAPEHIPRLVQQLRIIDHLCTILAEAGIMELISISREVFEVSQEQAEEPRDDARPSRRRQVPRDREPERTPPERDRAYKSQNFNILFRSREKAMCEILNELAAHPMFSVVTSWKVINSERPIAKQPGPAKVAEELTPGVDVTAGLETTPRGQRIILGREDLEVALSLDVYRFSSGPIAEQ